MWRAGFGRGFGPVVRQTTEWIHIILHDVPPSVTWGRAIPWWQGPTYHGHFIPARAYTSGTVSVHATPGRLVAYFLLRGSHYTSSHRVLFSRGQESEKERLNTDAGVPQVLDKAVCALLTDAILLPEQTLPLNRQFRIQHRVYRTAARLHSNILRGINILDQPGCGVHNPINKSAELQLYTPLFPLHTL